MEKQTPRPKAIDTEPGYIAIVTLEDDRVLRVDLSNLVLEAGFEPLQEPTEFATATLSESGTVQWRSGSSITTDRLLELVGEHYRAYLRLWQGSKNFEFA